MLVFKEKLTKPLVHIGKTKNMLNGTLDQTRTDTIQGLSLPPLPLGYESIWWGWRESNPLVPEDAGFTAPPLSVKVYTPIKYI